jgi:hypothetical protein
MSEDPARGKPVKSGNEGSVIKLASPDDSEATTTMNFRVPVQFHYEFKLYAAQHNMSMLEVLQESFRLMKTHHKR